jgi:signal transduction histidine kinase
MIGFGLIAVAAVMVAIRLGWDWRQAWVVPVALALGGLALAWSQLDALQRDDGAGSRVWARPLGGALLLLLGVLLLLAQDAPGWAVWQAGAAALAVLLGFGLMLAPWWLRLAHELGDARAARAREAERADIAAHLHDSVLQTLAMIRSQAGDPDAVARMARAQERELREWMYDDRPAPGTSFAAELRTLVAQVEDATSEAIDVVIVGDCLPSDATSALLQAAREALVNASAHGRAPVSVYAEASASAMEVFVRDRGDGFDIDAIAQDRFGVRESIIGRMSRRSGSAEIVSRPGWGTEVRLTLPLDTQGAPQ